MTRGKMREEKKIVPEIIPVVKEEEVIAVASLARDIWTEHYVPIIGQQQVDYMLERFQSPAAIRDDINQGGFVYDLVLLAGRPAAYMASRPDMENGSMFLSKLYVAKEFRNRGIARLLMAELIGRASRVDIKKIWLTVNRDNLDSIRAYERIGFEKAGKQVKDIGSGYVMDDYVMSLEIHKISTNS